MNDFEKLLKKYNIKYKRKERNDSEECYGYVFNKGEYTLYVELYDDCELGYIINDEKNKCIIENEGCDYEYEMIMRIIKFFEEGY